MAAKLKDTRKLERTSVPGVFRRHAGGCKRNGRCRCPYVVTWRDRGRPRKQMFPTFDLAREHKGALDSGRTTRQPLSSETVGGYYERWLPTYRGRTVRGLEDSTRSGYEASFRLQILPFPIACLRMRDLGARDMDEWFAELERAGGSPSTIRRARVALSVMLACAVQAGDIVHNPAAGVRYVPSPAVQRKHPKRERRKLTAEDVVAILNAMPERWRAFFTLLAQTGVRIGELLGLTWKHVHLGDDPHIMVAEQVYKGKRKRLKTEASRARVPLSSSMAAWLTELRPEDARLDAPVFPSKTGGALTYANVYNRVLRPALVKARLAVKVGETAKGKPIYDYQGVAFHAFRKACGSLLLAHGKSLKQVQGWLRHSQLTTTMNIYIHEVDDGLGGADAWDDILPAQGQPRGNAGATAGQRDPRKQPEVPAEVMAGNAAS
jgi:integrase